MMKPRSEYERIIFPLVVLTIICWAGYILSRDWGWQRWEPGFAMATCISAILLSIIDVVASLKTKITTMQILYVYADKNPIIFWIRIFASVALGIAAAVFLILKLI
ncbi:hypothetical protein [Chitiniphilus eburneus]|uniref:Uncharacterized protein n=1 Tax=Chitiniphilus eburneus TaxID=2571148 RepID=A0A4U0Q7U2_9NEIS|nr:hypothetical protein [Chitiniphilus eburneus]TJZ77323.1 hypothetical protein FAZ21_02980 [Chitiniphilus eburneus]